MKKTANSLRLTTISDEPITQEEKSMRHHVSRVLRMWFLNKQSKKGGLCVNFAGENGASAHLKVTARMI